MNQIKIPFVLKIIFFFLNFILILNFIVFQNFLSILAFIPILIAFLIQFFLFKNKKFAIISAMFLPFVAITFWFLEIFENFKEYLSTVFQIFDIKYFEDFEKIFYLILALITIIYEIFLILTYLKLRKKDIEFNTKNQEKKFCISFALISLFLIIFYFGYYNIPEKFEEIPDETFATKLTDKDTFSKENIYIDFYDFNKLLINRINYSNFYQNIFYCLFWNKCVWDRQYYIDIINYLENPEWKAPTFLHSNLKSSKETMSIIEKLNTKALLKRNFEKYFYNINDNKIINEYLKLSEKEWFFKERKGDLNNYSNLQIFYKENLKYKIFYLLCNWEEDKAIDILTKNFKIIQKIINWEISEILLMIETLWLKNTLEYTEYILKNFNLSDENKNKLKQSLEKNNFSADEIAKYAKNFNYLLQVNSFFIEQDKRKEKWDYSKNLVYEDSKNYLKKIFKGTLETKNYLEIEKSKNIFKRNILGRYFIENDFNYWLSHTEIEKRIKEVLDLNQKILNEL